LSAPVQIQRRNPSLAIIQKKEKAESHLFVTQHAALRHPQKTTVLRTAAPLGLTPRAGELASS